MHVFTLAQQDPKVKCDVVTYSSLLSALSRSKDPQAPYRASEVFEQMVQASVEPDTMSWTILLSIWARSSLPRHEQEAQAIFDRFISMGRMSTSAGFHPQPSAVTYTVRKYANMVLFRCLDVQRAISLFYCCHVPVLLVH